VIVFRRELVMERGRRVVGEQQLVEAFSSPIRREILWRIWEQELPAGEIAGAFELSAPTISQHLAVLRKANLVSMRVDGTFRRYRANKDAVSNLRSLLPADAGKWVSTNSTADPGFASSRTVPTVVVTTEVATSPEEVFTAFTDGDRFGAWLGVPVTLDDGHFACTMEWGVEVRGTYDYAVAPSFIAMRWDFGGGNVPPPGSTMRAYLNIVCADNGRTRVELHQMVDTSEQAAFMERAWRVVLGRFAASVSG
jgi:DNA-binding transcriptional ArsR family regulator/uncharacterized protein YndB with AHSA1/START domain